MFQLLIDVPNIGNPLDDLNDNSDLIDCLSKDAKAKINEFVFNIVKKELLELVIPVSKHVLKEKINSFIAINKSLISFNR